MPRGASERRKGVLNNNPLVMVGTYGKPNGTIRIPNQSPPHDSHILPSAMNLGKDPSGTTSFWVRGKKNLQNVLSIFHVGISLSMMSNKQSNNGNS